MKWIMQNGEEIEISKMETRHIRNSIAMLERKGFISESTSDFYLSTDRPNGEAAQDLFDMELHQVLEAPVSPFLDAFKEELQNRGVVIE